MKVSVAMITYNHEPFIRQALDGVLSQRTSFPFELVIGEDHSTDRTREIVQEYARFHPEIIRPLLPEKNVGMAANFINTIRACKGEYIALLEGDDYWNSPDKLEKQAAYLDAHPECSLCFHRTAVQTGFAPPSMEMRVREMKSRYSVWDYLEQKVQIGTCATFFRRSALPELPDWFWNIGLLDVPLRILVGQHGDFGLIDEILGVYRVHEGGVWSAGYQKWPPEIQRKRSLALVEMYDHVIAHMGPRAKAALRSTIATACHDIAWASQELRDAEPMRHYVARAWATQPFPPGLPLIPIFKTAILAMVPGLCRAYMKRAKRRASQPPIAQRDPS